MEESPGQGQFDAKLIALRAAIDEGDASGLAEDNVFERVRKALKQAEPRRENRQPEKIEPLV